MVFPIRHPDLARIEGEHRHTGSELNLIVSGRARRLVGGLAIDLRPGDLLHIAPRVPHQVLTNSPDFGFWVIWLATTLPLADPPLRRPAVRDRRDLVQLLRIIASRDQANTDALILALESLLAAAWPESTRPPAPLALHPATIKAVELIRHRHGQVNLDVVAAACRLSRSRLSHVFSQNLGLSLAGFRNVCRLERLDALRFARPQAPLTVLVGDAGFASYLHLYRAHRRHRGGNPSTAPGAPAIA